MLNSDHVSGWQGQRILISWCSDLPPQSTSSVGTPCRPHVDGFRVCESTALRLYLPGVFGNDSELGLMRKPPLKSTNCVAKTLCIDKMLPSLVNVPLSLALPHQAYI